MLEFTVVCIPWVICFHQPEEFSNFSEMVYELREPWDGNGAEGPSWIKSKVHLPHFIIEETEAPINPQDHLAG